MVVGPAVEGDRQGQPGVDARPGGVEGELADGDPHATRPLVAQPEDPLVVGGHDEPDPRSGRVGEQFGDPVDVVGGDPATSGAPHHVAELPAGMADRRGIDDRSELFEVVDEQAVEKRLVAVLQRGEADVALDVIGLAPEVFEFEVNLLVHCEHP